MSPTPRPHDWLTLSALLAAGCASAPARPAEPPAPRPPAPKLQVERFAVPYFPAVEDRPDRGELRWALGRSVDLVQVACEVERKEAPGGKPLQGGAPRPTRVRCAELLQPVDPSAAFHGLGAQNGVTTYLPRVQQCFRVQRTPPTPALLRALEQRLARGDERPNAAEQRALEGMASAGRPLLRAVQVRTVDEGWSHVPAAAGCDGRPDCQMGPRTLEPRFTRNTSAALEVDAVEGALRGAPVFPEQRIAYLALVGPPFAPPALLEAAGKGDWKAALALAQAPPGAAADASSALAAVSYVAWSNRATAARLAGEASTSSTAVAAAQQVSSAFSPDGGQDALLAGALGVTRLSIDVLARAARGEAWLDDPCAR